MSTDPAKGEHLHPGGISANLRPEFTGKGWKLVAASLLLIALGSLFLDYMIIGAGIVCATLLLYAIFQAYMLQRSPAAARPVSSEISTVAGGSFLLALRLTGLGGWTMSFFELTELPPFKVKVNERSEAEVTLSGSIQYTSFRQVKTLVARRLGWLGLLESFKEVELKPSVELKVYPRFVAPLYRLLVYEWLLQSDTSSYSRIIVTGTGEYRQTRDYYPGDELRFIDWRATARTGDLKVKEFASTQEGSVRMVLDTTSTDAVSADMLAAQFISSVLDHIERGYRVEVSFYDGRKYITVERRETVKKTAEKAVSMVGRHVPEMGRILELPMFSFSTPENTGLHPGPEDGSQNPFLINGKPMHFVVVSQLLTDVADDIAAASAAGGRIVVVQPTTPWLWVRDLEDAYLAKTTVIRNTESLRRAGVRVFSASASATASASASPASHERLLT